MSEHKPLAVVHGPPDKSTTAGPEPELTPEQIDVTWQGPARAAREALALLGYRIEDQCLPGEDGACGGTNIEHAAAYFGALSAVLADRCGRLGPEVQSCIVTGYRTAMIDMADAASKAGT